MWVLGMGLWEFGFGFGFWMSNPHPYPNSTKYSLNLSAMILRTNLGCIKEYDATLNDDFTNSVTKI